MGAQRPRSFKLVPLWVWPERPERAACPQFLKEGNLGSFRMRTGAPPSLARTAGSTGALSATPRRVTCRTTPADGINRKLPPSTSIGVADCRPRWRPAAPAVSGWSTRWAVGVADPVAAFKWRAQLPEVQARKSNACSQSWAKMPARGASAQTTSPASSTTSTG